MKMVALDTKSCILDSALTNAEVFFDKRVCETKGDEQKHKDVGEGLC